MMIARQGLAVRSRRHGADPWRIGFLVGAGAAKWGLANAIVAALYFVMGYVVSVFFAAYGLFPAPIWLPTSVATVAAMIGGWRCLPGIFLGSFLANSVLFDPPLHITSIISLTNALGPVAGAAAARRLRPPAGLFDCFSGVIIFIVCTTLLSPAISAAGGALALAVGHPLDMPALYSVWVNWWLTDSGGTLYLAPALLLWLGVEHTSIDHQREFDRRDVAVWLCVATIALLLFATPPLHGSDIRSAFPFLLVVPLSWIALQMSLRAAYTLVSFVSIIACAGTVAGFGPFQGHAMANPLQLVGALVVLLAMTVLTIVALFCERRQAERASAFKTMFLAHMSHELRTPLNAIIGLSELMTGEAPDPSQTKDYREYAGHILRSGLHLLSLINDVLDISRIEAGRFELQEESIALREAIEHAVGVVKVQADGKTIAVAIGAMPGEVILNADRRAVQQMLINVLSNAVKFTPNGGRVQVDSRRGASGELVISVADNGVGIPEDSLERVFAPFERADAPATRSVEGTGLGLSITRGLVELHGGAISLTSKLGRGTTVMIVMPAMRVSSADLPAGIA
jgi:two-component system, cell cycle sensor histidine kinase PleC